MAIYPLITVSTHANLTACIFVICSFLHISTHLFPYMPIRPYVFRNPPTYAHLYSLAFHQGFIPFHNRPPCLILFSRPLSSKLSRISTHALFLVSRQLNTRPLLAYHILATKLAECSCYICILSQSPYRRKLQ